MGIASNWPIAYGREQREIALPFPSCWSDAIDADLS